MFLDLYCELWGGKKQLHFTVLCHNNVEMYKTSLKIQLCPLKMTLTKADLFNCSDEIAGCIEKAYEQIQFSEATRVLFFSSPKKMTDYAKKVSLFSFGNQACSQIQIL